MRQTMRQTTTTYAVRFLNAAGHVIAGHPKEFATVEEAQATGRRSLRRNRKYMTFYVQEFNRPLPQNGLPHPGQ